MGYYTDYKLSWKNLGNEQYKSCEHNWPEGAVFCPTCGKPVKVIDIPDEKIIDSFSEDMKYALGDENDGGDNCKWYEHEKDMKTFSIQFPCVLFVLKGNGEESGDIWIKYFLDGKMQLAKSKITYDEFDSSKLKG